MRYRLVCAAAALALTGCFADPPSSSGSGGDASTSSGGSGSTTTSASTSTAGTTEAGSSTSVADASSSGSGSSSGEVCDLLEFEPGDVPADIVVLIEDGTPVDQLGPVLDELQAVGTNNIALLAPSAALAELEFDSDCPSGCEGCPDGSTRITVPYDGNGYDALVDFDSFTCAFRESMGATSGPAAQIFIITSSPLEAPPASLGLLVLNDDVSVRVHVACPGCEDNLLNVAALLQNVVLGSGGSVSDTMDPPSVVAQAQQISTRRMSCLWPTMSDPGFYFFGLSPEVEKDFELFAGLGEGIGDCALEVVENGAGVFVEVEPGLVLLCPDSCSAVQRYPAEDVEVFECIP